LSALGFVHIFRRRPLIRQWHEDAPALHSEGGLPGAGSADIVAFIRECLVHVVEDPILNPRATEVDEETLHAPGPSFTSRESEYLLGAGCHREDNPFPFMNTDIALGEMTDGQKK
jgi:hypothetical protein